MSRSDTASVDLIWGAPLFGARVAAFLEAWAEIIRGSELPKRVVA